MSATKTSRKRGRALGLALGIAALGTFLVTPRPTRPRFLPFPDLDPSELGRLDRAERERAESATKSLLPIRTRVVGEELRRLELARLAGSPDLPALDRELRRDVAALLEAGATNELLGLRALQGELFVRAVGDSLERGEATAELRELGGRFYEALRTSWLDEGELALADADLRLLFRVRWGLSTGTHRLASFGPTLDEERRYYALLLERPEGGRALDPVSRAEVQIGYALALAKLDPAYPGDFAVGVLALEAERHDEAASAFRRHLARHPSGPWARLAENHLRAALRAADAGSFGSTLP